MIIRRLLFCDLVTPIIIGVFLFSSTPVQAYNDQDSLVNLARKQKIKRRISRSVKRKKLQRKLSRRYVQRKVAQRLDAYDRASRTYEKIPNLPAHAVWYEQADVLQASFTFNYAGQAYSSQGRTVDAADQVFSGPILFKDIVLTAKLAQQGVVESRGGAPGSHDFADLNLLADVPVNYKASRVSMQGALSFARHFYHNHLSAGFSVPYVLKEHTIRLSSAIPKDVKATLHAAGNFKNKTLDDLINTVYEKHEIDYRPKTHQAGIGDAALFAHFDIPIKKWSMAKALIGAQLLLPTATKSDRTRLLWQPVVGNEGFAQLKLFSVLHWQVERLLNPYLYLSAAASLKGHVRRRVPRNARFNQNRVVPKMVTPVFNSNVKLSAGEEFNEWRTTVAHFAQEEQRVKLNKGFEFFCRLGNVFNDVIIRNSFLELSYDLFVKTKDHLGFIYRVNKEDAANAAAYDYSQLTRNSSQFAQTLYAQYGYHFDGDTQLRIGGSYTLAGKNVFKEYSGYLQLNVEF